MTYFCSLTFKLRSLRSLVERPGAGIDQNHVMGHANLKELKILFRPYVMRLCSRIADCPFEDGFNYYLFGPPHPVPAFFTGGLHSLNLNYHPIISPELFSSAVGEMKQK